MFTPDEAVQMLRGCAEGIWSLPDDNLYGDVADVIEDLVASRDDWQARYHDAAQSCEANLAHIGRLEAERRAIANDPIVAVAYQRICQPGQPHTGTGPDAWHADHGHTDCWIIGTLLHLLGATPPPPTEADPGGF